MGGTSCPAGRGPRVGQQDLSPGRAHDRALAERRRILGTETNAAEAARPWRVIDEVLEWRSIDA